jgi:hypothetical protein
MAIVLPVQVKDSAQARRELESVGRASSQLGTQTAKANQEMATTAKEAAQETANLKRQQTEMHTQLVKTAGSVAMAAGQISMLAVAVMEAKNYTGAATTTLAALTGRIVPLGLAVTAAAVAVTTLANSWEYLNETAAPAAAAAEASMASLRIVTEKTGNSIHEATQTINRFDDALTSRTAIAGTVRIFNTMGQSMEQQQLLIERMRDGIIAMGGDVNTQLPLMAKAIKQGNSELLDNMGVVSTIEMMMKRYAASIGTTVDKLTQEQREEAILQGVLQETAKYVGSAAAAMDTATGKTNALATENRKLAEDIGRTFEPLTKLKLDLETIWVRLQRWTWKNLVEIPPIDPHGELDKLSQKLGLGRMPVVAERERAQALEEAQRKLGMAHSKRAENLWKVREGGYGPLFPDKTGDDERKFYENQAKASEQADREAKRKADERARTAKAEADRVANDQKRLAEQLQKDLLLIDATGADQQRIQAKIHLDAMIEQAHDSAQLEADARRLYWKRVNQIDRDEEAKVKSENNRTRMKFGDGGLWFDDRVSRVKTDQESINRQQVSDVHQLFNEHFAERERKEQDLLDKRKRAEQDIGQMRVKFAEEAANMVGSLAANAIRTGEGPSGGDVTRTGANVIAGGLSAAAVGASGTVVGLPAGVALAAAAALTKIGGEIAAAILDRNDNAQAEAARAQQQAAEDQRRAAEEQLRAAKQRADDVYGAGSAVADQTRWLGWEKMLADAKGTDRYDALKAEYDTQRGIEGRVSDFKDSLAGVSKVSGGHDAVTLAEFAKSAKLYASDGEISGDDLDSLEKGRYGEVLRDARGNGMWGTLVQALQNLAEGIELENRDQDRDRVVPGSSPQTPSYNVIVNFKDLWSSAPRDAYFRSGGPGTRREGSSDRAIKVSNR